MRHAIESPERPLRAALLFSSHPLPIWIYDLETLRILAVNDAAVAHYGCSRDELLHKRVTDLREFAHDADEMVSVRSPRAALPFSVTRRHRRKDGTLVDVHILARPVMYRDRPAVLAIAQDITELKRAAEGAQTLVDRLADLGGILTRPVMARKMAPAERERRGAELDAFYHLSDRLRVASATAIAEVSGIALRAARLCRHLEDTSVRMVLALSHALETRDAQTAWHCRRIVHQAELTARALGCSEEEIRDIRWAARLHDVGKVGIPDAVLRKATSLTDEEWGLMRQHAALGEKILGTVPRMRRAATLVRHHQEAWDGSGYPDGLRGQAIPLGARIVAVVDAFAAMTEHRPYRAARTDAEALAELWRCAGTKFDPRVVETFVRAATSGGGHALVKTS